jgi:hypothetical protein
MAGKFITPLEVELLDTESPAMWRLLRPLVYESEIVGLLVVPSEFVTDFASVPRLPVAYLLAGDTCHKAAVVHDWLYTGQAGIDRARADAILREAAEASGVSFWRRWLIWAGVRVGGAAHFEGAGA